PGGWRRFADGATANRLDRDDLAVRHRGDGRDAGAGRLAVDVDGAGAAERHAAAELAAGEPELVPQGPQQRGLARHIDVLALSVDVECDHRALLSAVGATARRPAASIGDQAASICPSRHNETTKPT